MPLDTVQGDGIPRALQGDTKEFTDRAILRGYAGVAYDAFWNRRDRLFNTPALFRNRFFMQQIRIR